MMGTEIDSLKQALANTREQLNAILDQAATHTDAQVYSDGLGWNVRQLVVHLADADKGHNGQIMAYAEGRELIPPDFDIERYNKRVTEKKAEMSFEEARAALNESRSALNAWLDAQDDAVLEKVGRHATLKMMTIREFLQTMIAHENLHGADIARVIPK
jgi:uncharacterized damage-inducible protein DinB